MSAMHASMECSCAHLGMHTAADPRYNKISRWLLPYDQTTARFNALSPGAPISYARVERPCVSASAMPSLYQPWQQCRWAAGRGPGVQQGVYFRQVASHTAGTLPKYMSVALLPAIVKVE